MPIPRITQNIQKRSRNAFCFGVIARFDVQFLIKAAIKRIRYVPRSRKNASVSLDLTTRRLGIPIPITLIIMPLFNSSVYTER